MRREENSGLEGSKRHPVLLCSCCIFLNRQRRRFHIVSRCGHVILRKQVSSASLLFLLAFRLDKRLTSLPSLDERAVRFPLFLSWSPFFFMNGFVLLLPHNPPPVLRIASTYICHIIRLTFVASPERPWRGNSNQRIPMIKNPARARGNRNKDELVRSHYLSSNNRQTKVKETKSIKKYSVVRSYCTRSNNLKNLHTADAASSAFLFRLLMAVATIYWGWLFVNVDEKHQQG